MKKIWKTGLALSIAISTLPLTALPAHAATPQEIAAYWAPEFYQDTNDAHGYKADYLSRFDYDGDWSGLNNWENLYNYPTTASVYYSVVETGTHYYIGYYTFHPRDDGPMEADRHENDMEACMFVIQKDGSTYGRFQLMETNAHDQWYQYTNDPFITTGTDNIDGGVLFSAHRPKVFIQANGQSPWNGHGVHAYDGSSAPGGDGIVYYYGGFAEQPAGGDGNYTRRHSYDLVPIDQLWDKRNQIDGQTYADWGVFAGNTYKANAAKAPWAWDDSDDGATFTGDVLSDPAHFVDTHLNGLGYFSHTYTYHPYYTHKITVSSLTSKANRDPFGGRSDIYPKVKVAGEAVTDDRLWKKNDAPTGTKYSVIWGRDSWAGTQYSEAYNYRLVAKKWNAPVSIEVLDSDGTSGDESMGSVGVTLSPGYSHTWTDAATSNGEALVSATVEVVR